MNRLNTCTLTPLNTNELTNIEGGKADPITVTLAIVGMAVTVYGTALTAAYFLGHQAAHEDCGH